MHEESDLVNYKQRVFEFLNAESARTTYKLESTSVNWRA